MELVRSFRDVLVAAGRDPAGDSTSDETLAELCTRGRAAFPSLDVSPQSFVRHLASLVTREGAETAPLEDRFIGDLYLACACLQRVAGAAEAFDAHCTPAIRAAVGRLAPSDAGRDEIVQKARDALLVGSAEVLPKLALYLGTGPLPRWVATTGQRLALLELRADRAEGRARSALAKEPATPADPELAYLKRQYKSEFEATLGRLVAGLDDRERVFLRLHLIEGLSAEKIGRIYGMSRATAQRRIEDVREKIADGVRQSLRERLALSVSGVGSVADLVASQVDVSLSRILRCA